MINRDENGVVVSADSISDITKELSDIEKLMNKTVKSGADSLDEKEKTALISKINDMNVLINFATEKMKNSSNPLELIGFVKQVMKIKTSAEKFKDTFGELTEE